jgi:nucleotide-binding universal stress UspA family protein
MKTIVVGTDGSASSMRAVQAAADLAAALHAELHVACSVRLPNDGTAISPMSPTFSPAWLEEAHADAAAAVARAAETARQAGATVTGDVLSGEPAHALIDYAANVDADLLVLGSRGMRGTARFLLGSVPNRCAHHAGCSVLIVRTG